MRVLMTTDPVGGVWQYSLSLARGLVEQHDCRVALVCFGSPSEEDAAEALALGGVELMPIPLKLEWMPDSAEDVKKGIQRVSRLIEAWKPDLVHSNQFCFGFLDVRVPRVIVAHSDVLSWRVWARGKDGAGRPDDAVRDPALQRYRELVVAGLAGASAVVCPSRFMARCLVETYRCRSRVIYNGLWPDRYPVRSKEMVAVLAGRLWDDAKRVDVAVGAAAGLPLELRLVGPTLGPNGESALLPPADNVTYLGGRNWLESRDIIAAASFYLATSSYEPFGLAALEAALCGCTLVANDAPAFREMWEGAATFYRRNDSGDLRLRLTELLQNPMEAMRLGQAARERALERFTAGRMARQYMEMYATVRGGLPHGLTEAMLKMETGS